MLFTYACWTFWHSKLQVSMEPIQPEDHAEPCWASGAALRKPIHKVVCWSPTLGPVSIVQLYRVNTPFLGSSTTGLPDWSLQVQLAGNGWLLISYRHSCYRNTKVVAGDEGKLITSKLNQTDAYLLVTACVQGKVCGWPGLCLCLVRFCTTNFSTSQ